MPDDSPYFLDRKPGLYLKDTPDKGRGVFCVRDIEAGEELEATPAIILNEREHAAVEGTILHDYVFTTGEISKAHMKKRGVKNMDGTSCVVMGIASYCNHAGPNDVRNAEVVWEERGTTLYYVLQATRAIPAGTEICTSYGDTWFEDREDA